MLGTPGMEASLEAPAVAPLFTRRRARSRRPLYALAALAALAAVAWLLYPRFAAGESSPVYTTDPAARTRIVSQVTATGTLSPVVSIEVGSQVSGRVAVLHADYNARVKAGDLIAEIDARLFESAVAQAEARLVAAEAALRKARAAAVEAAANHRRTSGLAARGVVAQAEVDTVIASKRTADANVSSAQADITVARAALEQARVNLAYTRIEAPIDGVVISRNVDVGQTVAASLSAPVLFVIAGDMSQMELHTSVAESDVGRLADNMKVSFTVDAFPGRSFAGVVKQVRYEATTVSNVVTYDAVVLVDNRTLELRPGMTANVSFIADERADVLAVSNKALRFRPANPPAQAPHTGAADRLRRGRGEDGDRRVAAVWVLRDGAPLRVRIETGLADDSHTEVTGGELREGDLVIVSDGVVAPASSTGQATSGRRGGGRRGPPSVL